MTIRNMRAEDLEQVLTIERRSFPTPWTEQSFRGLMRRPTSQLWVAVMEGPPGDEGSSTGPGEGSGGASGAVAAYAVVWRVGEEAELGDLAVHPDLRGRGIGSHLLASVLEETAAQGVREIYLEVRRSNGAARRLYERSGFEVVGVRRGYYASPPEDAVVMRSALLR